LVNLGDRVGGFWFSTLRVGDCDNPEHTECTWKLASTVKRVNASCVYLAVGEKAEALVPQCFARCPNGTADQYTSCYIHCFYAALLGNDAATVRPSTGGLSGAEITALWTSAFDGCPSLVP
jgi:hypothetical protein